MMAELASRYGLEQYNFNQLKRYFLKNHNNGAQSNKIQGVQIKVRGLLEENWAYSQFRLKMSTAIKIMKLRSARIDKLVQTEIPQNDSSDE